MTRPVDSGCNSIFVSAIGKSSEILAFTRLFHARSRVVNVTVKHANPERLCSLVDFSPQMLERGGSRRR
jgi:hypothetical protein